MFGFYIVKILVALQFWISWYKKKIFSKNYMRYRILFCYVLFFNHVTWWKDSLTHRKYQFKPCCKHWILDFWIELLCFEHAISLNLNENTTRTPLKFRFWNIWRSYHTCYNRPSINGINVTFQFYLLLVNILDIWYVKDSKPKYIQNIFEI